MVICVCSKEYTLNIGISFLTQGNKPEGNLILITFSKVGVFSWVEACWTIQCIIVLNVLEALWV